MVAIPPGRAIPAAKLAAFVIEDVVKNGGRPVFPRFTTDAPPPFDIGFLGPTAQPPFPPKYLFPLSARVRLSPMTSVDPFRYVEYNRFAPDESRAAAKPTEH